MSVQNIELTELEQQEVGDALFSGNLEVIKNVRVKLKAVAGEAELSVGELMDMKSGSLIKLNSEANTPITIFLDDKPIAQGNLVAVDDNFGIQITEIAI